MESLKLHLNLMCLRLRLFSLLLFLNLLILGVNLEANANLLDQNLTKST